MPGLGFGTGVVDRTALGLGGVARAPAMLPALATPGAHYHAVYSNERLIEGYAGPLAAVATGEGAAGIIDLGAGRPRIVAADLPAPVTPLYGWHDQTGGGRAVDQDTLAHRPRLRADARIGAGLAAAFAGVANLGIFAGLSGAHALAATARTELLVIHPTTSLQNAVWSEHADAGGAVLRDLYVALGADGGLNAAQKSTALHVPAMPQVVLLVETAAGATLYRDGVPSAIAAGATGTLAHVTLGMSSFGAQFNANLRLAAYGAIAGAIDAGDAAAITAALHARLGIRPEYDLNLVHSGDSVVEGVAATDTIGLGAALLPLLARRTRYWNLGVAGQTQAQCFAARAAREAALIAPGKTNVALIDAGINDLGAGTTGASLYAGTTTPYAAALKAMGYRVGIVTLLPQASANYPTAAATIDAERQAYNAAVRGNAAGADIVVDRAAEPHMGRYPASCADATLYSPTIGGAGIHPTTLGYGWLAPVYAAAIDAGAM